MLSRDGPIPEDNPLLPESRALTRLHTPAAHSHAHEPRARHPIRPPAHPASGAASRPRANSRRLHGVLTPPAVLRLPDGGAQERPGVAGTAANAPARNEPDEQPTSGRRHTRQQNVQPL